MALFPGRLKAKRLKAKRLKGQEMRVVTHHPLQRLLLGGGVAAVVAVAAVGGFWLGSAKAGLDADYVRSLEVLKQANAEQIAVLRDNLTAAGLNREVDAQTAQELRETIKSLRDEIGAVTEEVTFYKSLMAPSSLARGLQIAEFEVEPTLQENQFTFHVLLTQVETRRDWVQGDVSLRLRGRDQQVLSLTEIAEAETYPLKFRFRYFQDLSGVITLPEGFEPESVEITARRRGAKAADLTRSFAWRAEPGGVETEIRS